MLQLLLLGLPWRRFVFLLAAFGVVRHAAAAEATYLLAVTGRTTAAAPDVWQYDVTAVVFAFDSVVLGNVQSYELLRPDGVTKVGAGGGGSSIVFDTYETLAAVPQGDYTMHYTLSLAGPRTAVFSVDMVYLPLLFAANTRAALVEAITTNPVGKSIVLHLGPIGFRETTQVYLKDSSGAEVLWENGSGSDYVIPAGKMKAGEGYVLFASRHILASSKTGNPPYVNYVTELRIDFTAAAAPQLTLQPIAVEAVSGGTATFSVAASGAPQPSYQWQRNGVPVTGATEATLTLSDVKATDAGVYTVVVTNAVGSATSEPAELRVLSPPRLVAVSTRSSAGEGEDTLIAGFVINGSEPKDVLLRAVGPTLAGMGVAGAMPNPRLQIYRQQTPIMDNDDWGLGVGGGSEAAEAAARLGDFPLPAGSADAALVAHLDPGVYTAHVTSGGGAGGIVLLEVYDAGPATDQDANIVALSTRGRVEPGDGVLIAGFVIGGNAAKRVMVRGVGPGMAGQVSTALSDPHLTIFSGSTAILENDDWSNAQNASDLAEAARLAGATALTPGSKDAAVLVELDPGVYTAHVRGVGGVTGVALVEIYEAP